MATRQAGLESGWISLPVVRPSRWMWRAGLSDSLPKATIRTLCADLAARDAIPPPCSIGLPAHRIHAIVKAGADEVELAGLQRALRTAD